MARNARLVVRVVFVPGGAGAGDARRRVADVLLRAANSQDRPSDTTAAATAANAPLAPPSEKAA